MKPHLISIALCLILASASAGPVAAQVNQLYGGIGRSTEGWTLGAGMSGVSNP